MTASGPAGFLRHHSVAAVWWARARQVLATVLLGLALSATTAGVAVAADPLDCSPPPPVDAPGSGMVGQLDPVPMGTGHPGSLYDTHGYAGLRWHTYGYSGPCAVSMPWVNADNWLANQLFNVAKVATAATTSLHYTVVDGGLLDKLDDLVATLSVTLYDQVFTPYLGLLLMLAAIAMFGVVLRGDLARVGSKTLWLLAGLTVATLTYAMPMTYVAISNDLLVDGATELEGNILKQAAGGDTANGMPTLLHEHVVVAPWLRGEFGSADSADAARFGNRLLETQACSKIEQADHTCDPSAKHERYAQLAAEIATTPAAEPFSGAAGRTGTGVMAVVTAASIDLFPFFAKTAILFAQIIVRMLILAGPVLGGLAIVANQVLPAVLRAVGTALVQALLLVTASCVHLLVLGFVLDPARGFTEWQQVLIMALITSVLWVSLRPWQAIKRMAASTTGTQLPSLSEQRMHRYMRRHRRRRWGRRLRRIGGVDWDFWQSRGAPDPGAAGGDEPDGDDGPRYAEATRIRPETGLVPRPNTGGAGRPEGRMPSGPSRGSATGTRVRPHGATPRTPLPAGDDSGSDGGPNDPGSAPDGGSPRRGGGPRPPEPRPGGQGAGTARPLPGSNGTTRSEASPRGEADTGRRMVRPSEVDTAPDRPENATTTDTARPTAPRTPPHPRRVRPEIVDGEVRYRIYRPSTARSSPPDSNTDGAAETPPRPRPEADQ